MIPFIDIHAINARFEKSFKNQFQDFLDSGYYVLGNQVSAFESRFADYCETQYCIGVGNGLDALRLILEGYKVLGKLELGDEVIVASNTYIATIIAIKQAGLQPLLVEVENQTFNFDISALKQAISPTTKAIIPVHLYGQIAPMEQINSFADYNNLLIIEDAAQAHGAIHTNGKRAGNLGHAAVQCGRLIPKFGFGVTCACTSASRPLEGHTCELTSPAGVRRCAARGCAHPPCTWPM